MANYFTQFSCMLDVGARENVALAVAIRRAMADEMDRDDEGDVSIEAEPDEDDATAVWIHGEDAGNPEHVIAFALRCAEAFELTGRWGFCWSLSCSKPRLDGYGGGAHLLDLGTRASLGWIDYEHWLQERQAEGDAATPPAAPERGVGAAFAIRRVLDVPEGEMSAETCHWVDCHLGDHRLGGPVNAIDGTIGGERTRHGWLLRVPGPNSISHLPADLEPVLAEARRQSADFVLLDCDTSPYIKPPMLRRS